MAQRKNTQDRVRWSHGTEQESNESISQSLTPEVQFIGGVYRTTAPTYSNNDNVIMSFDASGQLITSGGGASTATATHRSPVDFTATFTSATTITLSGLPFSITNSAQIAYIKVVPSTGDAFVMINGAGGVTITESSNVITVAGGTTLVTGDVYEVGINSQDKAYDLSLDVEKNTVENPDYARYTSSETLVTAQDLTTSYADYGSEIDVQGYNRLGVFIVHDVNTSEDCDLQVLGLDVSGGSDEYSLDGVSVKRLWTGVSADFKKYYEFDVGTVPFIQLQAKVGTLGTAGDLTIKINKKWRN